jgi:outer membrane receptor protein involved in Fe transport
MSRRLCAFVILAIGCAQAVLWADAGALRGAVTAGPQAAGIANARVSIRGGGRQQQTQTDADGFYQLAALVPGIPYVLTVDGDNLRTFSSRPIVLQDGELRRLDVTMELADARYSVLVTGSAVAARSTAPDVSQRVDAEAIENLPSVTRSTTKYALLNPHVRQVLGLGADFTDASRLSINAGSYRHTGYMLDGAPTYDYIYANSPQVAVSPGAVRDMNVLTGQYSAQYGLSTTGVVSITTPSGTDLLKGEGFTHIRPTDLQERPPLATFDVPNTRTDWGAFAGGPIARARTFFFGSYERSRQNRGAYIQSPVPGFFDGETSDQYGLVRVDHRIGNNQSLTARFNGSETTTNNANDRVSGFNQASFGRRSHVQSLGGQGDHRAILGGSVNQLRISLVAYTPDSASPLQTSVQVVRPNYATEGFSTSNWVHARSVQVGDQLTLSRGRHDVKFGGDLSRLDAHDYSFTPLGTYTFAPGPPQANERPLTFSQTFGAADLTYGQTQGSAFVQDDIRVSPRVTANLGLRYEAQSITDARKNFAPRLGVSWDASGSGRTIVRSGAGVFYDQYYMYLTRRYLTLGPDSPQTTYSWSAGDPGFPTFPESFTAAPTGRLAGARDIMIPDDTVLNPRSVQYSVSVERQLGSALVFEVKGLDSHTTRQMRVNDINHPAPFERTAPGQIRTPQAATLTRPLTTYQGVPVRDIARIDNSAETIYRSLDIGLTRRYGGWGGFGAHYVWSSSIAHSMFYADANSGVPNEWWDDSDRYEGGPGDFHQPHRLVADAVVSLPLDSLVAVVAVAASGLPVNPITGRDNNGDSYTVDRPIGLDRNSFRGPAQFNVDLAAGKRFRLASRWRAEARLEIFNLLNRANFIRVNNIFGEGPAPAASFLAPVAGITNADPPRQVQFAFKVTF